MRQQRSALCTLNAALLRWSCVSVLLLLLAFPSIAQEKPPVDTSKRKKVNIEKADFIRSMLYEGRVIQRLIGNVQLMHNGARMTCDSAYYYSDYEFDAFSRVVIVKGDTRLYGDELNYDGNYSLAQVRGKIVRLLDKTAVLRTQFLDFDTKENIGHFYDGGTIDTKENLIESSEGYYYSNHKLFVFKDSVEMRNETYLIRSDSGRYNTNTDIATFETNTKIWHDDGFLSCDNGWYDKPRDYFHFSKNAYILSGEREMWADSIFYNRKDSVGDLYGHIQVHDTLKTFYTFGNEGHFSEKPDRVMMTRTPSVAYYTNEDNKPDTLFIRADTLRFFSDPNPAFYAKDSIVSQKADSLPTAVSIPSNNIPLPARDSTILPPIDTASTLRDSLAKSTSAAVMPDSSGKTTITKDLEAPSPKLSVPSADTVTAPLPDSTIRQLFAYFKVRIYRSNVQGVGDSLAYSSLDSLARMFGKPALWNEQQQITSDEMHFLTNQQEIIRADFLQNAFIIANEQDSFYNQVKGRDIIGYFRDNDIYRMDVMGGAQTIYYMQEDSVVANANLAESAGMQIDIAKRKIRRIKYISQPVSDTYPLDKLPRDKGHLKGFLWRDAERPKSRWEVCTETPRPSRRTETGRYLKPTFPITARINKIR